ncbi:MAG: hypothetical protein IPM24_21420 [Bryobacterales bacterium]|jgi:hypothetical protein|nr:hypothetical protein [Bryobacterales bacterium]
MRLLSCAVLAFGLAAAPLAAESKGKSNEDAARLQSELDRLKKTEKPPKAGVRAARAEKPAKKRANIDPAPPSSRKRPAK